MDAANSFHPGPPGLPRLLDHCQVLERVTGNTPDDARERLDTLLGPDLASRLLGALAAGQARVAF